MNKNLKRASYGILAIIGVVLAGCGDSNAMTKAEVDASKNAKPMTDKDRETMIKGMAQGGVDAKKQEAEWAKANKDKLDKVNAERAKLGRPPLGQLN